MTLTSLFLILACIVLALIILRLAGAVIGAVLAFLAAWFCAAVAILAIGFLMFGGLGLIAWFF